LATLPRFGHDTGAGHDALAGQTGLAGHARLLATTSALAMQTELAEPTGLLPPIALPGCGELAGRAASPGLANPAVPPEFDWPRELTGSGARIEAAGQIESARST
jgi:hypothetical protein